MADNYTLPTSDAGGGTFAADDVGGAGVLFPRSKITIGADGTNDGDVSSANPLPVAGTVDLGATDNAVLDAMASSLVTIANAVDTEIQAIVTAVQLLDNVISGTEAQVDIVGELPTGTNVIGGVTQSGSWTVTANLGATDNAVLDAIAASVAGTITVSNAGTFAVQASQSTAANLNAQVVGNVASAATDSGNPVKMGGVFNSTPPTVTTGQRVNLQTNARGSLQVTPGPLNSVFNIGISNVGGTTAAVNNGAVSAGTLRVTVASDSTGQIKLAAGTASIGKLGANSGVDIGDVDVTSLPTSISGPGDPVVDSYDCISVSASANTANQTIIAAPGANKQIWVYGWQGSANTGSGSISWQDEDDTAASGVIPLVENGGYAVTPTGNFAMPVYKIATNKALEMDTVTCGFEGALQYAVVDVS